MILTKPSTTSAVANENKVVRPILHLNKNKNSTKLATTKLTYLLLFLPDK